MSIEIYPGPAFREVLNTLTDAVSAAVVRAIESQLLDADGAPRVDAHLDALYAPTADYFAARISTGHVEIYRMLSAHELAELARQRKHDVRPFGVAVFDLLDGSAHFPGGSVR